MELENVTVERELARYKRGVDQRWGELVYDGQWFSPLKRALDTFVDEAQQAVSGEIRMTLHGGRATVTGRRSEHQPVRLQPGHLRRGRHLRPVPGPRLHRDLRHVQQARRAAGRGPELTAPEPPRSIVPRSTRVGCGVAGSPAVRPRRWPPSAGPPSSTGGWRPTTWPARGRTPAPCTAAGLLTDDELAGMLGGLQQLEAEVASGALRPAPADEDVHGALERGWSSSSARARRPAPGRPVPQRPDRHPDPALPARRRRAVGPGCARWSARCATRRRAPRRRHAGPHPPAARAAGPAVAPPAGARLAAAARRRADPRPDRRLAVSPYGSAPWPAPRSGSTRSGWPPSWASPAAWPTRSTARPRATWPPRRLTCWPRSGSTCPG